MITARQVAEKAAVSISTVGRALADDPRISAKTKQRVRRAAASLGYVGSGPARMMRGQPGNLIGLMLPDIRNYFYATIAEALSACCDAAGYQLAFSIAADAAAEARHVRELVHARAAGIIIVPTPRPSGRTRDLLRHVPHVALLRAMPSAPLFGIDDEEALRTGTSHLLALGHRRIAYIGGTTDFSTGRARLKGFRRALDGTAEGREYLGPPSSGAFAARTLERIVREPQPPTALILGSVQMTQAVVETVHRLKIAKTLSIVGFGDAPGFDWMELTTLRPPVEELASLCGEWFLARLKQGGPLPSHYAGVTTQLVCRSSTAKPAS